MSEQYKLIHPVKFYRDYIDKNVRPDGREHQMFRPLGINSGTITESIASSVVKLGNTNIICGIRAELAKPRATEPCKGYLVPNVDMSFIPFASRMASPINELSDTISSSILDILVNSGCINLEDLCIHREKLVWSLHFDIICLDHDGCVFDAAILACLASLKNLSLPKISYDSSINKVDVLTQLEKLDVKCIPIISTYAVLENSIFADPTFEEETLSSAIINIGITNGNLKFILKSGGRTIQKKELDFCVEQSIKREKEVLKIFKTFI